MKRYLLGLVAVVLALGFSAFKVASNAPVNKFQVRYAVYSSSPTGTNPQTIPSNYTVQSSQPSACQNTIRLCWIKFNDADNQSDLDQSELDSFFTTYDSDGDDTLDDESEVANILEKKQ